MDASYLPGLIGYLVAHTEVVQSLTVGVAVAVAMMVALFLRSMVRAARPRTAGSSASLAALDVVIWPLFVVVAVTVIERFRLLS